MNEPRSSQPAPKVSVGLPVYNGERFLAAAIDSVLQQTFSDFELILSDNGSTDSTAEICRRYQDEDPRVRFHRAETNLGAARNFGRVLELARGELFRWMAADDLLAPTCIERCVEALEVDPEAVLAHTDVRVIDGNGHLVLDYRYRPGFAGSDRPADRYLDVMLLDRWCTEIFALTRTGVLRSTRGMDRYIASDRILRAELALRGRYTIVPELLFFNRDHPERLVRAYPSHHMRAGWFDTTLEGKRVLPHWRIMLEYIRCVQRAPITALEKARCHLVATRWLTIHWNWARLIADLIIVVVPSAWKPLLRASRAAENWLGHGP